MSARSVTVRSFAKINLDLRVLHKRPDGYHELRTVFHTITLADTIRIEFERARRTQIAVSGNADIPDNLIVRAARAVLDTAKLAARIGFVLKKRIPMGAGLGGGSSNAAAVLLALPVLSGAALPMDRLAALGAELGSDVPFFLYGGAALGLGRGTELYPLPDLPARAGVLAAPGLHVSTAEAYRGLGRELTTGAADFDTVTFRSFVWSMAGAPPASEWTSLCANDFERPVFRRYPALLALKRKLAALGARPAMMTGSGSALFGLFGSRTAAAGARAALEGDGTNVFSIELLSRRRYRAAWRRQLAAHAAAGREWPPRSRYSKP